MGVLAIIEGFLKLAGALAGWLESRQQIASGKARAMRASLKEAQELVRHARRIDADTAALSPDARSKLRRAIRREAGSSE